MRRAASALRKPGAVANRAVDTAGRVVERAFVPIDRRLMRRNRNLATVPWRADRRGGKISYGEWAWVIGLMQSLIATHLPERSEPRILDVGCGTGLVSLAALPLLGPNGRCLGIDVMPVNVDYCRKQHSDSRLTFELLPIANAAYAPDVDNTNVAWPVDSESQDLVTALSVWTHLDPATAETSLAEVERVLRSNGRAILSFFIRREYDPGPTATSSAYHRTSPTTWVFDRRVAEGWWTPRWTRVPEQAMAIDLEHLEQMATRAGLRIERIHDGYWTEQPGLYFQDIVILGKP